MNFELTEQQSVILTALDRLVSPFKTVSVSDSHSFAVYSQELASVLLENGYLDIGTDDTESAISSALVLAELAKLPVSGEFMASLLIRPNLCPDVSGSIALGWKNAVKPIRFLPQAKTLLILEGNDVKRLDLDQGDVSEVESVFAYPMGKLNESALNRSKSLGNSLAPELRKWWGIGIALEIHGALDSALKLTVQHVTDRLAFGKPLGTLQVIQHRLAMNATNIQAILWLALRAAYSQSALDAALATGYAQQAVANICYDLHQFSGAMGLTLEYPLHLYTYRAKLLQSELGGTKNHWSLAANEAWPEYNEARSASSVS